MRPRLALAAAATATALVTGLSSPATATITTGLATVMFGADEAPTTGDPDGVGVAVLTFDPDAGRICFRLRVVGIAAATAAHIHEAPAGVAGPIVVPLAPPTDGRSSGCVAAAPALVADIIDDPEDYYVNVHNRDFPGGALRGQLG